MFQKVLFFSRDMPIRNTSFLVYIRVCIGNLTNCFTGEISGLIGKWHLGLNCNHSKDACHHPLNMGFDEFYGLPLSNLRDCGPREEGSVFVPEVQNVLYLFNIACLGFGFALAYTGICTKKFASMFVVVTVVIVLAAPLIGRSISFRFVCILMRGFDVVEQPVIWKNLTVKFTSEAKHFIRSRNEKPFLLFMSYAKVHAVLFTSSKFRGHSVHGRYGDNVEEMDWSVGEIISTLEKEKILDNTFIYFTSDHGPFLEIVLPSGEHLGGWKGQYRGGKSQIFKTPISKIP